MSERLRAVAGMTQAVMKPAGFTRQRNAWRRERGGFVDIVNLQLSKSFDCVFVNLGVIDPDAYRWSWARDLGVTYSEPDCTVRSRLGPLIDGHDHCWSVEDPASPAQVADLLREIGLPWLDRMHSLDAMRAELAHVFEREHQRGYPPTAIALAVLQRKTGDPDSACATITARMRWPLGGWIDRVEALALDIGCTDS